MWGWIAAGVGALYMLTRPKAPQQAQPQRAYIRYQEAYVSPPLQAHVGDVLAIEVPSLTGTAYAWGVDGGDKLTDEKHVTTEKPVADIHGAVQDPGKILITFTAPGTDAFVVRKRLGTQTAELPMLVPVTVS
jgi:hypothetical protein